MLQFNRHAVPELLTIEFVPPDAQAFGDGFHLIWGEEFFPAHINFHSGSKTSREVWGVYPMVGTVVNGPIEPGRRSYGRVTPHGQYRFANTYFRRLARRVAAIVATTVAGKSQIGKRMKILLKLAVLGLVVTALNGCDQRKAAIDANTDAMKTDIDNRKDAVALAAQEAKNKTDANAAIDKARIDANKDSAQAQLDADKKKADADARAEKAKVDAEKKL